MATSAHDQEPQVRADALTIRLTLTSVVPVRSIAHLIAVPVFAGERAARFVVDTGMGVTLVSSELATAVGCVADGRTYTGRRMSGQEVTLSLGQLRSLTIGDHRSDDVTVGIFDFEGLAMPDPIDGFLALDYFRQTPMTVDYQKGEMVLEDDESLETRSRAGVAVTVDVHRDGPATSVFLPLHSPAGGPFEVEVDTGSDSLILDVARANEVGVDLQDERTRKFEGRDETGNSFVRYFATAPCEVGVVGAPEISQTDPEVGFQQVIYDGLVGNNFLRNFVVTYDLAESRMIFSRPRSG